MIFKVPVSHQQAINIVFSVDIRTKTVMTNLIRLLTQICLRVKLTKIQSSTYST